MVYIMTNQHPFNECGRENALKHFRELEENKEKGYSKQENNFSEEMREQAREKAREMLKLPLWRILDLALKDLQEVAKNKKYLLIMREWHKPAKRQCGDICMVCLGGCVLANTLKIPPTEHEIDIFSGENDIYRLVGIIEALREGKTEEALERLGKFGREGKELEYNIQEGEPFVTGNPLKHLEKYKRYVEYLKKRDY